MTNERHEKALEAAEQEWTKWSGGPRPHDPRTEVEVMFRDGRQEKGVSAFVRWWHEDDGNDIIWFRPNHFTNGE